MLRKQFFGILNMLFKINVNIILNGDSSNFNRQFNLLICFKILPIMYNNLSVAIDNISDHIELCYLFQYVSEPCTKHVRASRRQ